MPVTLISIVFAVLLVIAAVTDFLDQRIPNWLVIAFAALFAVQALRHLPDISWINQLGAGALCLVVDMVLFALGQMGAGDAKLLAVVALWCGLRGLLPLLFVTSIAGLVLVGSLLVARRLLASRWGGSERLPKSLRVGQGVPFGVAIATGSILTISLFPGWLWLL